MVTPTKKTIDLGDGRVITIETGKLAKQADGAVELRMNNTMLLATVVSAKEAGEGVDFMPLQVEYKEKFSAFGRFPGGFQKREGRASDYEILTARLVDRVLRPLFPDNYHADTFVNIILFSSDGVDMPDALAGLAASAAIAVSDVPFNGPISEVRVARIDGKFVINPTFDQLKTADMDLMVGATYDNIMMVEGEMDEVSLPRNQRRGTEGQGERSLLRQGIRHRQGRLCRQALACRQLRGHLQRFHRIAARRRA